ncbi:hypothetical protein A2U01_0004948 [Trifolium medium]|uniref:Uncharacterized protein n=1 Tax=Trifolium medium TaxID=97028 RepID=A0A392M9D7_9FABA|nr:hypothetical protein [Trifolium medium]
MYPIAIVGPLISNYGVLAQGYKDHLTSKTDTVDAAEKPKWAQIDAQLCNVIKSILSYPNF